MMVMLLLVVVVGLAGHYGGHVHPHTAVRTPSSSPRLTSIGLLPFISTYQEVLLMFRAFPSRSQSANTSFRPLTDHQPSVTVASPYSVCCCRFKHYISARTATLAYQASFPWMGVYFIKLLFLLSHHKVGRYLTPSCC